MTQQQTWTTDPLVTMSPALVWQGRVEDHRLPLWIRVVSYAEAHAHSNGHCPLTAEQLHQAIDPTMDKALVSRAIRKAVDVGWLHRASSARCLILGRSSADQPDCPATHRRAKRRSSTEGIEHER